MNSIAFRNRIIVISTSLFALSLSQDAFVSTNDESYHSILGFWAFLWGTCTIFNGELSACAIWLANPFGLISIYYFCRDSRKAIITGIAAFVLAGLFILQNELRDEKITSLKIGYFLWLASIAILIGGIIYYFSKYPTNKSKYPTFKETLFD